MRARGRAKARIVRSLLDEKDWRPRLELLARVYPGEYGRREVVPPAEPERKPMVTRHVFETGGKTLQEPTNFPISGDLTPPAEPKEQAAPAAPAAQRCPIVGIGKRVIGWTDVADGADPEEADLP